MIRDNKKRISLIWDETFGELWGKSYFCTQKETSGRIGLDRDTHQIISKTGITLLSMAGHIPRDSSSEPVDYNDFRAPKS